MKINRIGIESALASLKRGAATARH